MASRENRTISRLASGPRGSALRGHARAGELRPHLGGKRTLTAADNCALKMFDSRWKLHPGMSCLFEYGYGWRGEVRISKRADRKDV